MSSRFEADQLVTWDTSNPNTKWPKLVHGDGPFLVKTTKKSLSGSHAQTIELLLPHIDGFLPGLRNWFCGSLLKLA